MASAILHSESGRVFHIPANICHLICIDEYEPSNKDWRHARIQHMRLSNVRSKAFDMSVAQIHFLKSNQLFPMQTKYTSLLRILLGMQTSDILFLDLIDAF